MNTIDGALQTDEETRSPVEVVKWAREATAWAVWHPGDGTQYRVKIIPVIGGPDDADRVLLVSCTGSLIAVQYADPKIASYRAERITHSKWRSRFESQKGYDWWPKVIEPLLRVVGVAA